MGAVLPRPGRRCGKSRQRRQENYGGVSAQWKATGPEDPYFGRCENGPRACQGARKLLHVLSPRQITHTHVIVDMLQIRAQISCFFALMFDTLCKIRLGTQHVPRREPKPCLLGTIRKSTHTTPATVSHRTYRKAPCSCTEWELAPLAPRFDFLQAKCSMGNRITTR